MSKSVVDAAAGGDRRELLVALRDRIAPVLDSPETHPRDLNVLSARLLEVTKELAALDAQAASDRASLRVVNDDFDPAAL